MKSYFDHLSEAMNTIALNPKSIFCGQAVTYDGTAMRNTLLGVPADQLLEFPVDEDFQMGFCTGLAMASYLPVCIFPRWNFLLLATNQIVNYLDKVPEFSNFVDNPKVIIRTAIGSTTPLHPGVQHVGDFTEAFRLLLGNINVVRLDSKEQIIPEYVRAATRKDGVSTILVEWIDQYQT